MSKIPMDISDDDIKRWARSNLSKEDLADQTFNDLLALYNAISRKSEDLYADLTELPDDLLFSLREDANTLSRSVNHFIEGSIGQALQAGKQFSLQAWLRRIDPFLAKVQDEILRRKKPAAMVEDRERLKIKKVPLKSTSDLKSMMGGDEVLLKKVYSLIRKYDLKTKDGFFNGGPKVRGNVSRVYAIAEALTKCKYSKLLVSNSRNDIADSIFSYLKRPEGGRIEKRTLDSVKYKDLVKSMISDLNSYSHSN